MKDEIRVSVAIATYNGGKYLTEQLDSVIKNICENDEIVISDDGSNDNTKSIIGKYILKDARIKMINGPQKGVKQNFENAIRSCKGKYIFLCDQDDVWKPNKINKVLECFEKNDVSLVVHDAEVIDEKHDIVIPSFFQYRNSGKGIIKNIWKNTYIGCCMAFKNEIKNYILPIPLKIEMHEQWIGILNEKYGKTYFLNEKLLEYRRHTTNVSSFKHHSIGVMIRNRCIFIKEFIMRGKKRR